MNRHATLDDLARLGVDGLRSRKAAKVSRHLATCSKCTKLNNQLSSVPALLSSVQFPEMPASLATRIDSILAAEAAQRVAAEPATEAERRNLPVGTARGRGRPGPDRRRTAWPVWRLPVPATRVVATAGAIIVVGLGGYEIASHAGSAAISSSSSAEGHAAVQTPFASQASLGPSVTYQQDGSSKTIETVTAGTNFTSSNLAHQAEGALTTFKAEHTQLGTANVAAPTMSASGPNEFRNSATLSGTSQLSACIDRAIKPGQAVLLVERAKFENKPATILVTAPASVSGSAHPKEAEIWVLGDACSAANSDVLDHVKVARL